jgi:hypothetical protein
MLRPPAVVRCLWIVLALPGCIQRHLDCPPLNGSTGSVVGTGRDLIGPRGIQAFGVQGETGKVAVQPIAVAGQPFAEAIHAEIKEGSGNEWSVQLQAPTTGPVEEGDVLLATFYLRADKPLEGGLTGQTQFVFEQAKEPYAKGIIYDAQAGPDWRAFHVPFVSKQSFGPGEAHMNFHLGYEPETIDIGGITIENFGHHLRMSALPTTKPWSPPKLEAIALAPIDGGPLEIDVDPSKVIGPISPYVYGVNSQQAAGVGVTVRRMGGNRQTTYNWEINASNAGSDYKNESDDYPCSLMLPYRNCNEPAAQFLDFAAENKQLGAETLATIPLVDYVAADKKMTVSEAEKAPSPRWDRSVSHKNGPYAATPDLGDGVVYEDEFVDYLVRKLGRAEQGGVKFYSLDNEPSLWSSLHPLVHPEKTTYREMVARTEAVASAITTIDPTAVVLGGVMYGWNEYLTLQDAPDSKEFNAQYGTYADFLLASLKGLEDKHHRRLVHVLDLHWYPETRGTKRITEDDVSPRTIDARLQAPRAFWDPTYREKSSIDESWGKPIRLFPWLFEKIAKQYPGTKLSLTEYAFGAGNHVSGGLAQADVLGVLGREGVYLASYWGNGAGVGPLPAYVAAAFELYRNYDGRGGAYGDTAIVTKVPDVTKASVFAATDSKKPGRLTILVINKDQRARYAASLAITGKAAYRVARVYRLDPSAPRVQLVDPNIDIRDNRIQYALPPLSATLFVCDAS